MGIRGKEPDPFHLKHEETLTELQETRKGVRRVVPRKGGRGTF